MSAARFVLAMIACAAAAPACAGEQPTTRPATAPSEGAMTRPSFPTRPGEPLERLGDEIMVCGQLFHTGTAVVLWTDPGGYDAYRVERRFAPLQEAGWKETEKAVRFAAPNRYGLRDEGLAPEQIERVRGGGWDLPLLREKVDQFVIHYDVAGTSRQCFKVLHDGRGLSVHFLLDLDGTIYQTLDLKERGWHATVANGRSIGIEIANIGAYTVGRPDPFEQWYAFDADGRLRIALPERLGPDPLHTPGFIPRPARNELVLGAIHGRQRRQYDYTDEQYDALIRLTATLCTVLPKIQCDYPRDAEGKLVLEKLTDEQFARFQGVLGHYHIQEDKIDPGPAFQWDRVVNGAKAMMSPPR